MKGWLIVLLLSGQTQMMSFNYEPKDYDGIKGITSDEIVLSCSERAEELYLEIADHSWTNPRGQGWYLKDGTGTLQGHIC